MDLSLFIILLSMCCSVLTPTEGNKTEGNLGLNLFFYIFLVKKMLTGYICLCISCTEITQQKGGTSIPAIPASLLSYIPMTAKLKYLLQKYFLCNVFKRLTLRCVGTRLTHVRYPKRNILPGTLGFITTSMYLSFAVHIEFCMY